MSAVIVPEELEKQLTPAGSRALAMFVNEAIRDERGNVLELVEERFARRLAESEKRLEGKISDLRVDMAGLRADVIKWSFIFWLTQMFAIAGLFLTR